MINKDEIYNILTTILDSNSFEKDDKNKRIKLKHKLSVDEMDNVACYITNLIGQELLHEHDKKGLSSRYKFNSRFINIDYDSLKIDEYGRLYVDVDHFLNEDNIIEKILNNTEFTNKILASFEPTDIQMKFIIRKLLNNSYFLMQIANIVTAIQQINGDKEIILQQTLEQINNETQVYQNENQDSESSIEDEIQPINEVQPEHEEINTESENIEQEESTVKTLHCVFCHKEVSENDSACPHCGADLSTWKPVLE